MTRTVPLLFLALCFALAVRIQNLQKKKNMLKRAGSLKIRTPKAPDTMQVLSGRWNTAETATPIQLRSTRAARSTSIKKRNMKIAKIDSDNRSTLRRSRFANTARGGFTRHCE